MAGEAVHVEISYDATDREGHCDRSYTRVSTWRS